MPQKITMKGKSEGAVTGNWVSNIPSERGSFGYTHLCLKQQLNNLCYDNAILYLQCRKWP